MANQYINKVVYGNTTLIDLTADTVEASKMLSGYTAHDKSGAPITGNCTFDADTSDATATASEILKNKTAYVNGNKVTGSMTNVGSQTSTISNKNDVVSITAGYHDGSGTVALNSTEAAKIVAGNIKNGVELLGVVGTYTGSELIKATTKTATPYTTAKTYLPSQDGDYDYYTQVTVNAIAYVETDNSAGGKTVTIGTVAPAA